MTLKEHFYHSTQTTFQSLFDAFSAAFCSNYFDAEEERTLSTYIEREILMRYSQTYVFSDLTLLAMRDHQSQIKFEKKLTH